MSKICEKCGSEIPDELDFCPNCGTGDYNDESFREVLSGLGLSLEETESDASDAAEQALEPEAEEITETEESVPEKPEEDKPKRKRPKTDNGSGKKKGKKAGPAKKAPPKKAKKVREADFEDEYEDEEYERQPMKKRSAAIIGVLIGLFIALLLIAGVGGFMLYRLGVFNPVSDDDLLGAAQTPAPSVEATPTPVILEEPSPTPEVSAVEEAAQTASSSEEPQEPTESAKPGDSTTEVEVDEFTLLSDESITLYSRGETSDIDYVIEPESAKSEIVWASDNILVADVDDYGTIQARRGGECTITGTVGDQTIEVSVYCDFDVPLTVLDMNYEDITMSYEGQTVQLAIDYELSDEYVKSTVWESSDPSVATVDDQGLVTAVADGTAVIQASIAEYTASCIVRCVDVSGNKGYNSEESEYVINYEDVTLTRKGEYFQLTLKSILPDGEVPDFTWVSDDTSVATVDNKGVVTAVSDGVAYITATIGEDQFRCIVRVSIS